MQNACCIVFSSKKVLIGHSLKEDVDLNHYNAQFEEDLEKICDKVNTTMCKSTLS